MSKTLQTIGWIACIIYSTIPAFWLLIHPRADYWRARRKSPYRILLPLWIGMWVAAAVITAPWRNFLLYKNNSNVDSCWHIVRRRPLALQTVSPPVHSCTTRRIVRDLARTPRAAPRHHRHSRPRSPSRLSRPSLRDACLERRHGHGSVLGAHGIRDRKRCNDDSDGR